MSSIKTAVIAIILFLVLSLSFVVMGFLLFEYEKQYTSNTQATLVGITHNIHEELLETLQSIPAGQRQTTAIKKILDKFAQFQHVTQAQYFDINQTLVADYLNPKQNNAQPSWLEHNQQSALQPAPFTLEGANLVGVVKVGESPLSFGYLKVVNDLKTPLNASKTTLVKQTLPTVLGATVTVICLALLLLNRLLHPLSRLSSFMKQIESAKNYSLRFSLSGKNEIAQLAKNINAMLDTINLELEKNRSHTKTLEQQQITMTKLANYDVLTGLPNRQFVMDSLRFKLSEVKRRDEDLALLFFDLDGFKAINDSLGHEAGDHVLVEVANRVSNLMREGDIVSRLGGDEFLVIPNEDPNAEQIKDICLRILDEVEKVIMLNGVELRVGLSIGIAKAKEANYDLTELVSNADIAMYRSKANGRGTYTMFSSALIQDYKRKLQISNSILKAIENNEFHLYYQAKADVHGKLYGFEALIRWHHPEFGVLSPGEFIPMAEQSGKVVDITRWVIKRVAIEMEQIQTLAAHPLHVSLNLSAHDLRSADLFEYVNQTLYQHAINPNNIEFEVTESAYLESFDTANEYITQLSELGCSIALDDFGTGYSSLSYLTQIKVDTLKIDQQFVKEIDSSSRSRLVTSTIIDLAKSLQLTICSEGIESTVQQSYLKELGCDYYQGYLYSKPIPLRSLLAKELDFAPLFTDANTTEKNTQERVVTTHL